MSQQQMVGIARPSNSSGDLWHVITYNYVIDKPITMLSLTGASITFVASRMLYYFVVSAKLWY